MSPKRPDRASSPRGRERARQIIVGLLEILYGRRSDLEELTRTAADLVVDAALARPDALRLLDRRREIDRGWFQRPRMVGYVCYADRFAGDLQGVLERLDYLAELGVTYLHVMPLLKPREGPDDGGYPVADYRKIDPRLGSIDDLERLVDALHSRGMALCIDLVLNHTAAEHPWAQAALALDRTYRDFYRVFPDRTMPDRFERTVPEVFPDTSPGSFTSVEGLGWVWTTFESFQWDLGWTNPQVFAAMLDVMLYLANKGVDVLRLDAAPFLWKREGYRPEGDMAYKQPADGDALVVAGQPGRKPRCGGAASHEEHPGRHRVDDLPALPRRHRLGRVRRGRVERRPGPRQPSGVPQRLLQWHASRFVRARRSLPAHNPRTGDRRISGTAAALCGLDAARAAGDEEQIDQGVRRLLMLHSVVYSFGGIPLLYMGNALHGR